MKNYMITALYDEGYGGFNWETDIEKLDNGDVAEDICYRINAYKRRYMCCRETECVRREKEKDWREMKKYFHSEYPDIEIIVWVSNEDIKTIELKEVECGEWVRVSPLTDTYECNKCGYQVIDENFQTNYCPDCGVKMRIKEKKDGNNDGLSQNS